jgi:hypothetical protein
MLKQQKALNLVPFCIAVYLNFTLISFAPVFFAASLAALLNALAVFFFTFFIIVTPLIHVIV